MKMGSGLKLIGQARIISYVFAAISFIIGCYMSFTNSTSTGLNAGTEFTGPYLETISGPVAIFISVIFAFMGWKGFGAK